MKSSLLINGIEIISTGEYHRTTDQGAILGARDILLEIPSPAVNYYVHGWQSWSLTTWLEADRPLPSPFPTAVNPMRLDPRMVNRDKVTSSWVGAVELLDGNILLLGALGLDAHVEYEQNIMRGWYDRADGEWLVACGKENEVFGDYAKVLSGIFGPGRKTPPPRVWCSWYSFYSHPTQDSLAQVLQGIRGLPFDVFQIDDGWQLTVGDWEPNANFPAGMQTMADAIRAEGLTPGLWLAPLIALPSSRLFKEHPGWFLRDGQGQLVSAGSNWGSPVFALDGSQPIVIEWLAGLMKKIRGWGYDYLKLDFLYAGALPGIRASGDSGETALQATLRLLRDNLGDAYLLTCGVPILPSLGLCDALRIGPDNGPEWANRFFSEILCDFGMPGGQNALRTSLHRLWLKPLVHVDPDAVYFQSLHTNWTAEQQAIFQALALISGFRATSDLPRWLGTEERERLERFLQAEPTILQLDRYRFQLDDMILDFSAFVDLPPVASLQAGPFKRFIQRHSSSPALLRLANNLDDLRQQRRLRI